jgi:formate dehydrogenase subunit delta
MMGNREKLVYMANQIARNLAAHGEAEAVRETAYHITQFWDPRMRATIVECGAADGLEPVALAAVDKLRAAGRS